METVRIFHRTSGEGIVEKSNLEIEVFGRMSLIHIIIFVGPIHPNISVSKSVGIQSRNVVETVFEIKQGSEN